MTQSVVLKQAMITAHPFVKYVETIVDGARIGSTRPVTYTTREQAAELGYVPTDLGVWESLCDYHLARAVLGEGMFGGLTPTTQHEAREEKIPREIQLYEEALVLAIQRCANRGTINEHLAKFEFPIRTWADTLIRLRPEGGWAHYVET